MKLLNETTRRTKEGLIIGAFECHCGRVFETAISYVRTGKSKTCGCSIGKRIDGLVVRDLKEHQTWRDMKQRCLNKNHKAYRYYGARGISISDTWINSFETFYKDMGPRPSDGNYSLDRIDNNGNYCKENCRWATKKEQMANRRPVSEWNLR